MALPFDNNYRKGSSRRRSASPRLKRAMPVTPPVAPVPGTVDRINPIGQTFAPMSMAPTPVDAEMGALMLPVGRLSRRRRMVVPQGEMLNTSMVAPVVDPRIIDLALRAMAQRGM